MKWEFASDKEKNNYFRRMTEAQKSRLLVRSLRNRDTRSGGYDTKKAVHNWLSAGCMEKVGIEEMRRWGNEIICDD